MGLSNWIDYLQETSKQKTIDNYTRPTKILHEDNPEVIEMQE